MQGQLASAAKEAIKLGATIGYEIGTWVANFAATNECRRRWQIFQIEYRSSSEWFTNLEDGDIYDMPESSYIGIPLGGEFKIMKVSDCEVLIKCSKARRNIFSRDRWNWIYRKW